MVKRSSPKPKKIVQVDHPLPSKKEVKTPISWSSPAYTFVDGMGWEQHIPEGYHDMGH